MLLLDFMFLKMFCSWLRGVLYPLKNLALFIHSVLLIKYIPLSCHGWMATDIKKNKQQDICWLMTINTSLSLSNDTSIIFCIFIGFHLITKCKTNAYICRINMEQDVWSSSFCLGKNILIMNSYRYTEIKSGSGKNS